MLHKTIHEDQTVESRKVSRAGKAQLLRGSDKTMVGSKIPYDL